MASVRPTSELPTVTAVTAVYNYEEFVGRTLQSALDQEYPPELLDLVVVDDGSTDGTPDVLADFQRRHPDRIRVIHQQNAGYEAALSRGIAEAKGAMVAILDSDDLWPREKTRRQVGLMLEDPTIGLVYSDCEVIDPYDDIKQRSLWRFQNLIPLRGRTALAGIMDKHGNPALASTIMLRASVLPAVFPVPRGVPYGDWWMTARTAAVAGIDYVADVKVGYRQHGENLTLGATGMQQVREILKCAEMRRQLLMRGAADHLTDPELFGAWQAWEGAALTAVSCAGSAHLVLPPVTDEQRAQAALHAEAADRATHEGDLRLALRERIVGLACDPFDVRTREWLHDLVAILNDDADPEPTVDPLAGARGFVTLAYLQELVSEPQMLAAYTSVVCEEDDATLVIAATAMHESQALKLVTEVAGTAGLTLDDLPDVLLVTARGRRTTFELERRTDALLTRRQVKLGKPSFHPGRISDLRALIGVYAPA